MKKKYEIINCLTLILFFSIVNKNITIEVPTSDYDDYFNQNNINKDIIVPINLVDTYNIDNVHPAELLNIVFLNSMIQNGIKVVKEIK